MVQKHRYDNPHSVISMDINWEQIQPAFVHEVKSSDDIQFQAHELLFEVPLCHTSKANPERIKLQADLVYMPGLSNVSIANVDGKLDIQTMGSKGPRNIESVVVYLCGGPGDGNPASANRRLNDIMLKDRRDPILFLDYRGTRNSTPLTAEALANRENPSEYMTCFRQDAIVADLEAIRLCFGGIKFFLVGQSFGGWIAMTYVSFLPRSLSGVFITGGLPPIGKGPEDVYRALYKRVIQANEKYYRKYKEDIGKVKEIVIWLAESRIKNGEDNEDTKSVKTRGVALPEKQGRLTAQGFMTLGRHFGRGEVGFDLVHSIVTKMANDIKTPNGLTDETIGYILKSGGTGFKLHKRPGYGAWHEGIYCSGSMDAPPNWAAQRVGKEQGGGHFRWLEKDFNGSAHKDVPLYFSGEMIYDFMLEEAGPKASPFKKHADDLAHRSQWSNLYDVDQLKKNVVPVTALIYPEDMYVDYNFSLATAQMVQGCRWAKAPRDWLHASIKTQPEEVWNALLHAPRGG